MAILTSFKIPGNPDELLAEKKEKADPHFREIADENGSIAHFVARQDDGLRIYNVWESVEGMERTSEAFRPRARELGLTEPTEWQQFDVLQQEFSGRGSS